MHKCNHCYRLCNCDNTEELIPRTIPKTELHTFNAQLKKQPPTCEHLPDNCPPEEGPEIEL